MSNKMLIDASHQEETRVVVTRGQRIEEFDFESEHKKQIKGNIYLARVTRVEPSLQAAFVEYGGNRHGFLAFSEIHPDYYQIPVADRQILLEAEARGMREQENDAADATAQSTPMPDETADHADKARVEEGDSGSHADAENDNENGDDSSDENMVELVGAEDAMEEVPLHQHDHRRNYKIQEVIKKRQILLVQVVKEERGNKGAALTTYLSLAGRYSVLMPNTARGGGISRKIVNLNDRKRLKEIVKELEVPKGMGVILRTAGANRTRTEIKRDYEYLIRLWENVRNLTLSSIAPALVHEEGNLIKRSIRDLYNKNIDEILVAGEQGYREAKDFMRMLMPSHAKVVQPYRDPVPIFSRNGIELQLDRMFQPEVTLKSGGYLVMNQTEALVAIDVNSGRATKEHSVEETAVRTNLEAAEEVARQLRLRDLAGLVVIDFIDMAEKRNIRLVEKKLKDCLKDDRARIQVGHISAFGLLEMSRQRLRASVLESTTQICPHCHGTGYIRSPSSIALHVIRGIEEYLLRHNGHDLIVHTPTPTALYVLNQKRRLLSELETRFGLEISFEADDSLGTQHFAIHQGAVKKGEPSPVLASFVQTIEEEEDDSAALALEAEIAAERAAEEQEMREEETKEEAQGNNRHRRDKRRRSTRHRGNGVDAGIPEQEKGIIATERPFDDEAEEDGRDKRRRRGRRAGRRMRDYNGRGRLPFAEPVGPFAASALAALRHRKRARYAPKAEPVGPFVTSGDLEHNTPKPDATIETPTSVAIETVNKIDSAIDTIPNADFNTDIVTIKKSGRKTRAATADKRVSAAMETVAPLPSPVEDQETAPVKKPRSRRIKAEKMLSENITDTQLVPESVAEEPSKPQKKLRKKTQDVVLPVDSVAVDAQEKSPLPRTRRKKKAELIEEEPTTFISVPDVPASEAVVAATSVDIESESAPEAVKDPVVISSSGELSEKPKRVGWWQRKSFF